MPRHRALSGSLRLATSPVPGEVGTSTSLLISDLFVRADLARVGICVGGGQLGLYSCRLELRSPIREISMYAQRRMRGTTPEIERRAKELRADMTIPERILWKVLRKHRQAGFYFRRQHPIERFIVDFCCTAKKLCVEVDGPIHDEQQERDEERTAYLEAYGYRVIRFTNDDVIERLHLVARRIQEALREPG
ncbi:MAG TPA: endonuclease domain-containing protein [Longimicrobiaceae bacterium]